MKQLLSIAVILMNSKADTSRYGSALAPTGVLRMFLSFFLFSFLVKLMRLYIEDRQNMTVHINPLQLPVSTLDTTYVFARYR